MVYNVICKCNAIIPNRSIIISKKVDIEGFEIIFVNAKCVNCWSEYTTSFYNEFSAEDYENRTHLTMLIKIKKAIQDEINKNYFINMCNCGAKIYDYNIEYSYPQGFYDDTTYIKAECDNCGEVYYASVKIDIPLLLDKEQSEIKEAIDDMKKILQDEISKNIRKEKLPINKLIENSKDIDNEFVDIVNDNFFDLI